VSLEAAIKSVLRQYATFRGRAARSEFWYWYLFTVLVNIVTTVVDELTDATIGISFVGSIVSLGLLVPTLAVSVRRLHDSNLSGWWLLLPAGAAVAGVGLFIAGLAVAVAPAFFDNVPEGSGLALAFFVGGGLMLLVGGVIELVLMLRHSTPGTNRFGPHPGVPWQYPPAGGYGYPSPYGAPPSNPGPGTTGTSWPPSPGGTNQPSTHGPW
jgi:uncharacterized membrane protein YhaH (DUF805 family)